MPELADQGIPSTDSTKRWRYIAWWASLVFHAVLLGALAMWFVGRRNADRTNAAQVAAEQAMTKSPARSQLPPPDVSSKQVSATLQRATEKFADLPAAEQLNELDKQAAKLESLSSSKSVSEMADKFQEWIPTPQRTSEPAFQPASGEFDFDTAQIHDVVRTAGADGAWEYRSVLVDAGGRTFDVEIDRAEGEKVYAAFDSLKKFPLANQVYRQIVMGLMDRALQTERNSNPAADAPPPPADEHDGASPAVVDDRDPFDDSGSTR